MADTPACPVITVTPTVMDGTVVRWYTGELAAEQGRPLVSASRNGVMIHGDVYIHDLPTSWLEAAQDAHVRIRAGQDVGGLATHRHPFGSRELIPVGAEGGPRG
jgi:hypothetical protein